jgi:biotin transport system substrate-specific component
MHALIRGDFMPATARTLTLADAALPRADVLRNAALIAGASLLTALAARIAIPLPWSPVPVTGQTLAVLLTGMTLGARRGFLALALYLAEGLAGLPVFAGGAAGPAALLGPSGGYLMAFPLAAALTGALAQRGWDRRFVTTFAAMLAGSAVIFAGGLVWLARFVPAGQLLRAGLAPFVPGDILKASLAAAALPGAWRLVHGRWSSR